MRATREGLALEDLVPVEVTSISSWVLPDISGSPDRAWLQQLRIA